MPRRAFTIELLNETLKRDGATLIGEHEKLNRETVITYKCKCGNEFDKKFIYIIDNGGAKCKPCTEIDKLKKMKDTNIEKHGVGNGHSDEVKEKIKATNLIIYGVEHSLQSTIVKDKGKATNIIKYGVEHPSQSESVKQKKKDVCMVKYGVTNPNKLANVREKIKDTNLVKYGVEHAMQSTETKAKTKRTNLKKYGVSNPNKTRQVREKIDKTNLIKYGVVNPSQVDTFKQKKITTSIKNYGVEHPQQSKEVQEKNQKNAKKYKDFTFPSGTVRKVQGYEPYAIQELLKAGYTEEQIQTDRKDVPRISYEIDEKVRYYFPDIFIPHENKLIEVKSTWTYKCKPEIIELKKRASIEAGHIYEIWCYNAKGARIETTD